MYRKINSVEKCVLVFILALFYYILCNFKYNIKVNTFLLDIKQDFRYKLYL